MRGAGRLLPVGADLDSEEVLEVPEEVQPQKGIRTPTMPSAEDMAEHRSSGHLQYRDWCPDCVEAFGREWKHHSSASSGARTIPLISCDYLYITEKGVFQKNELQEEEVTRAVRAIVIFDGATKALFAHAVPKKGVDIDGYVVEQIKQDITWLGHPRVTLRGDNEPALVQVLQTAAAALRTAGIATAEEGSVPYDPQTNGAAENAVRLLKGTLRANMLGLERQIQARIPIDHPVIAWMIAYAAHARTMRVRGSDGRTAHQRVKGSEASTRMIPFGETCRYKGRANEGGIAGSGTRFSDGVWLGIDRKTGQYIVYDPQFGGIRNARTLMRLPVP